MEIKDYLSLPYSRVLIPEEDGGYSCSVLEFPGCFSCGETLEKAMININEAMELWLLTSIDLNHKIPTPFATNDDSFEVVVSLSKSQWAKCAIMSREQKCDIRDIVLQLIEVNL